MLLIKRTTEKIEIKIRIQGGRHMLSYGYRLKTLLFLLITLLSQTASSIIKPIRLHIHHAELRAVIPRVW